MERPYEERQSERGVGVGGGRLSGRMEQFSVVAVFT